MKILKTAFISLAVAFVFALSCSPPVERGKGRDSSTAPAGSPVTVQEPAVRIYKNRSPYSYSDTCIITGLLETESAWGPPGYGEDTLNDLRETYYILSLDAGVDVLQADRPDNSFDVTVKDIGTVQLNQGETRLEPFVGRRVRLTGVFFGAHTAHHRTPALFDVSRAEPVR